MPIGFTRRIADDHRDVVALVEIAELAQQVMVAELLAVIAGENDQRVVLATVFEVLEHPSKLVVDFGHEPVVGGAHLAHLALGHLAAQATAVLEEAAGLDAVDIELEQRMLRAFGLGRFRTHGWRTLCGVIAVVIALGRDGVGADASSPGAGTRACSRCRAGTPDPGR